MCLSARRARRSPSGPGTRHTSTTRGELAQEYGSPIDGAVARHCADRSDPRPGAVAGRDDGPPRCAWLIPRRRCSRSSSARARSSGGDIGADPRFGRRHDRPRVLGHRNARRPALSQLPARTAVRSARDRLRVHPRAPDVEARTGPDRIVLATLGVFAFTSVPVLTKVTRMPRDSLRETAAVIRENAPPVAPVYAYMPYSADLAFYLHRIVTHVTTAPRQWPSAARGAQPCTSLSRGSFRPRRFPRA